MEPELSVVGRVKIKKVPGGSVGDSEIVEGGVVWTGGVVHKRMRRSVEGPRILILAFGVEYNHKPASSTTQNAVQDADGMWGYQSLESTLPLERPYIRSLVSSILELNPSVLICTQPVARLAQEMLLDAGVVVASGVKNSVVGVLARCLGAEIVVSPERLRARKPIGSLKGGKGAVEYEPMVKLGYCSRFSVHTFDDPKIPGWRKSFVYLEGCPRELGCTIVLRGGTVEELQKVKEVVSLGVFMAYNLKLEHHLYKDQLATAATESFYYPEPPTWNPSDGVSKIRQALKTYETAMLSVSPGVRYPAPFLLQRLCEQEDHRVTQNKGRGPLGILETQGSPVLQMPASPTSSPEETPTRQLLGDDDQEQSAPNAPPRASHTFLDRARSLSPFTTQSLIFLFSNMCIDTLTPCQPPETHVIDFYQSTDVTLGQYLEELCAGARMETWRYSFGKYLELTFHHTGLLSSQCGHSVHRDHVRFFGLHPFAVRIEYEPIDLLEVSVPPTHLRVNASHLAHLKRQLLETWTSRIHRFYDSVLQRLRLLALEIPQLSASSRPGFRRALRRLGKRVDLERRWGAQELLRVYVMSATGDCLSLNSVGVSLVGRVGNWEADVGALMARGFGSGDLQDGEVRKEGTGKDSIKEGSVGVGRELVRAGAMQIKNMFGRPPSHVLEELGVAASIASKEGAGEVGPKGFLGVSLPKASLLLTSGSGRVREQEMEVEMVEMVRQSADEIQKDAAESKDAKDISLSAEGKAQGSGNMVQGDAEKQEEEVVQVEEPPSKSLWVAADNDLLDFPAMSYLDSTDLPDSSFFIPTIELGDEQPTTPTSQPPQTAQSPSQSSKRTLRRPTLLPLETEDDDLIPTYNPFTAVLTSDHDDLESLTYLMEHPPPAGERGSILKALSNLWAGAMGSQNAFDYPVLPGEHVFEGSPIVVREEEPSSIIAFTLSTPHYKEKLKAIQQNLPIDKDTEAASFGAPPPSTDKSGAVDNVNGHMDEPTGGDIEETLLRNTGNHIKFQFWDGPTRLDCKAYYADQFDALRRNCGFETQYVQSLSQSVKWEALGGKSGSTFLKTKDDRLILKQLSKPEMDALLKFAPSYFTYISEAFFHKLPTVLAKILGFYRIAFKNPVTGKSMRMDLLVMENLFYDRKISREHSKRLLRASVWNDTLFLSKLNVMDYSLLVGIDEERRELVVGIVERLLKMIDLVIRENEKERLVV
ncbi:1-phosphatidylinositol-3-phosphate 5-kinase [Chytridiales sp. JEL 0842]|nr:1-phosphatidylinositol-3-phosphate 5-kinase [Chytridiales sp. JEL 0842]